MYKKKACLELKKKIQVSIIFFFFIHERGCLNGAHGTRRRRRLWEANNFYSLDHWLLEEKRKFSGKKKGMGKRGYSLGK